MFSALLAVLPLLPFATAASYPRVESWSGDGFLDGFNYDPSTYDNTTNGDTFWARPGNTSLIYTSPSGTNILKVDNTTFVPYNEKRYAPKLLSKSAYGKGTVWVIDSVHLPYGCSVWPAFWTQGPDWPLGGEIDIMEGINNQKTNQIALHGANSGCQASPSAAMSGQLTQQQCANNASEGAGCTIVDSADNSYGAGFAAAGGGTYITELSDEGVKIWFYTRSAIPSGVSVDADTIDTGALGTPVAFYPSSSCNVDTYLAAQTLTINIALCGDWAGIPSLLAATCPALEGDMTCYTTYVINDAGATYANAYFELNYINIYSTAEAQPPSLAGPAAGSSASVSTTAGGSASTSGVSRNNGPTTTMSEGGASASGARASSTPSGAAERGMGVQGGVWGMGIVGAVLGAGMLI